jgi:ABC-2 type transport system permease protein
VLVCFLLMLAGFPLVLNAFSGWAPQGLVDAVAQLSFLTHFSAIAKGVLDVRNILFFVLTILAWLAACAVVLELKKAD